MKALLMTTSTGPSHIFYTPCSGIWQSVWIEAAPRSNYITQVDLHGDMNGTVSALIHSANGGQDIAKITIHERGRPDAVVATHTCEVDSLTQFEMPDPPELWSPESPTLYDVVVKFGKDTVQSYMGFRTIEAGDVDGVVRPLLNGKFLVSPPCAACLVRSCSPSNYFTGRHHPHSKELTND